MSYENRKRGCRPCGIQEVPKQEEKPDVKEPEKKDELPTPITPVVPTDPNVTLDSVKCGKKILSITKVGEQVIVMYEDCSYATAPVSVVATESFNAGALVCIAKEVKELKEKVSTLEPRVTTLEGKEDKDTIYDDTAIKQSIINIENKLPELINRNELVIVENLEGTQDLFKAFPLN